MCQTIAGHYLAESDVSDYRWPLPRWVWCVRLSLAITSLSLMCQTIAGHYLAESDVSDYRWPFPRWVWCVRLSLAITSLSLMCQTIAGHYLVESDVSDYRWPLPRWVWCVRLSLAITSLSLMCQTIAGHYLVESDVSDYRWPLPRWVWCVRLSLAITSLSLMCQTIAGQTWFWNIFRASHCCSLFRHGNIAIHWISGINLSRSWSRSSVLIQETKFLDPDCDLDINLNNFARCKQDIYIMSKAYIFFVVDNMTELWSENDQTWGPAGEAQRGRG